MANADSQNAMAADTGDGFLTCSQVFQKVYRSTLTGNEVSRSRLARYSIGVIKVPYSELSLGSG